MRHDLRRVEVLALAWMLLAVLAGCVMLSEDRDARIFWAKATNDAIRGIITADGSTAKEKTEIGFGDGELPTRFHGPSLLNEPSAAIDQAILLWLRRRPNGHLALNPMGDARGYAALLD